MANDVTFKLFQEGSSVIRKFPDYDKYVRDWDFFLECYLNPVDYADKHLFQYYKEGDEEYRQRKERAYRENHTERVVDLINSYLFKAHARRKTNLNKLDEFKNNVTLSGKSIEQFMQHQVAMFANTLGRVYVVVDKENPDKITGTHLDNIKGRPYAYVVYPQDVFDIAFDNYGNVKWALIRERNRDDDDPFESSGEIKEQFRLWHGGNWYLFDSAGDEIDSGQTGISRTPIIPVDSKEGVDVYNGISLVKDVAYIDRAIFNNWSRLDVIVNDQTFSQLIVPAEGIIFSDAEEHDSTRQQILEMATNRVFLYSAQAQVPPKYISPDASQAEFILKMIEKQTKQLYSIQGLSGEVASDVKVESGLAKTYDFDKLNKTLASKASNFEIAEKKIFELAAEWLNINNDYETDYPDDFDVKSLADEISYAQETALMEISETFEKEMKKNIAMKALPKVDKETRQKIEKEIDESSNRESFEDESFDNSETFNATKFSRSELVDNELNTKIKPKQ